MAEVSVSGILTVDLHGKNRYQAKVTLDALLKKSRGIYRIRVIHGYHGGTELSALVRQDYANHPAVRRVIAVSDGVTELVLREI